MRFNEQELERQRVSNEIRELEQLVDELMNERDAVIESLQHLYDKFVINDSSEFTHCLCCHIQSSPGGTFKHRDDCILNEADWLLYGGRKS